MEIPKEYYEKQSIVHNREATILFNALDLVKKFIIREQRILVGGMAIDYALRLKGDKIYDEDDTLPDYDFYSHQHFKDAYDIGQWLVRTGYENVSIINATHPTTMRVRVNFQVVADITFIPQDILDNIPFLTYHGIRIVHPHYQFIDHHHSLSQPYEKCPRETISHRWKKDIKRHDLLYNYYPLKLINPKNEHITLAKEVTWPIKAIGGCISGFVALNHWIQEAQQMGYKPKNNFGHCKIQRDEISWIMPSEANMVLLANCVDHAVNVAKVKMPNGKLKKFWPLLGIFTEREELSQDHLTLEIHDNQYGLVSAHFEKGQYFANLQNIMKYLLAYYILLQKMHKQRRGFSFYQGYLECRNLIDWASTQYTKHEDVKLLRFFPSPSVYGEKNLTDSYRIQQRQQECRRKGQPLEKFQPRNLYAENMPFKTVPKQYYNFDYSSSEVFQISGTEKSETQKQIENNE